MLTCLLGVSRAQTPECGPGKGTTVNENLPVTKSFIPPANPAPSRGATRFPGDRLVYWLHGLGGDSDSWGRVAIATQYQAPGQTIPGYPPRKVTSLLPTYNQFSFSGASSTLHNYMVSAGDPVCQNMGITDKSINFIIGHSQGGLVARATDMMYSVMDQEEERRFGGIVTFGTAHGGAQIINNQAQIYTLTAEACEALSSGPVMEGIQNNFVVDFFLPDEVISNTTQKLCNFVGNHIAPIILSDQNQPIAQDYKVGAAPLEELNGYNSNLPRVAFYGAEEEPVFYRVMYNLMVKKPNEFPPFEANEDDFLVNKAQSLISTYRSKIEEHQSAINYWENLGIPCGGLSWLTNWSILCTIGDIQYWRHVNKRNAWQKGFTWLISANEKYKTLIGATTVTHTTQMLPQCFCEDSPGFGYLVSGPDDCGIGCNFAIAPAEVIITTRHENDGVLTAETASAFPGAQVRKLEKSNHQQMRNDKNTKTKLNDLFSGNLGLYFFTETR